MKKELVWIDEDLVGKVDLIQDICRLKGEELENVINKLKEDDKVTLDCIDDSLIEIKHHAKRVRDEYEKCVNEELEKTSELWEKLDEKVYESRTKIEKYSKESDLLLETVKNTRKELENIPFYQIEKALELLNKINSLTSGEKHTLSLLSNIK